MSLFRLPGYFEAAPKAQGTMRRLFPILAAGALLTLSACTVEPLNASRTVAPLSGDYNNASVAQLLASTEVSPVTDRVAQQVRNELLFSLNGGELQPGGRYKIDLTVSSTTSNLSVQTDGLSPVSAQVNIVAWFTIVDLQSKEAVITKKPLESGLAKKRSKSHVRRAVAGYDYTSQSFANERAERDAQNRAAKDVALQIRTAVAQIIAGG